MADPQFTADPQIGGGAGGAPDDPAAGQPALGEQLKQLYSDGRALVESEFEFQRSRIGFAGRQARAIALFIFIGLVCIAGALLALVIGTMIALIPLLGAWGAMAAVTLSIALTAALCFWLAMRRVRRVSRAFAIDDEGQETT